MIDEYFDRTGAIPKIVSLFTKFLLNKYKMMRIAMISIKI